jgi:hypothetical protein
LYNKNFIKFSPPIVASPQAREPFRTVITR